MNDKTFKNPNTIKALLMYEILMISLSTIIVLISIVDLIFNLNDKTISVIRQFDLIICFVFAIDLCLHLIFAKDKIKCIKRSIITIIAIIPFSSLFRIAGILRLNTVFQLIKHNPINAGTGISRLWIFFMQPAVARITKFFNMARTYFNKRFEKKQKKK